MDWITGISDDLLMHARLEARLRGVKLWRAGFGSVPYVSPRTEDQRGSLTWQLYDLAGSTGWHNIYAYSVKSAFPKEDKNMKQTTRTLVTFLLDRTGSMEAIRDDTIGGFNAYLEGLKSDGGAEIDFTLIQFDSVCIDKI